MKTRRLLRRTLRRLKRVQREQSRFAIRLQSFEAATSDETSELFGRVSKLEDSQLAPDLIARLEEKSRQLNARVEALEKDNELAKQHAFDERLRRRDEAFAAARANDLGAAIEAERAQKPALYAKRTLEELMQGAQPGDLVEVCAERCADFVERIGPETREHAFVRDGAPEKPGRWTILQRSSEWHIDKKETPPDAR